MVYPSRVTSVVVIAGLFVVMLTAEPSAQPQTIPEQPLSIEGRILWIDFGSQTMVLEPANGGTSLTIDLHRIPQSQYKALRGNEYVLVVGFIRRPSHRIQAYELYLVTPWFPTEPANP